MDPLTGCRLHDHFRDLPDPRAAPAKRHQLLDIITLAICAVIGGADTWVEVALFGTRKEAWRRSFLALPNGIPSHDTFGRVFAALDPVPFETAFLGWARTLAAPKDGELIAIDGKTLRRSHDRPTGQAALHLVSAWASANHLVLGQVAVAAKSNEITAIPVLVETLVLEGRVVTIDAMGCQQELAAQIVDRHADYVLALKDNQPPLRELVADHVAQPRPPGASPVTRLRTVETDHGRIETRTWVVSDDPAIMAWLDPDGAWTGVRSIALVTAERRIGDAVSQETRYFLSSLPGDAARLASAIRGHWGIENRLHWVLDIACREDEHRVRQGHASENFAIVRRIALTLLRQDHTAKGGIKAKRVQAGWDEAYLLNVLAG